LKDEVPLRTVDNKLLYFKRGIDEQLNRKAYVYVFFLDGPPKIICPGCDSPDDFNGSEIMK
jgi:hypothetical protein